MCNIVESWDILERELQKNFPKIAAKTLLGVLVYNSMPVLQEEADLFFWVII